jgi:uncharacterized RDD family membrane protein YckC/Flp pilus assembly protein TadD
MSELDDDQAPLPRLQPAPLQPRILAGVIDGVAIFALGLAVFLPPFLMGAAALPVWAFLAAILGWAVVPLAVFGTTLGMRLMGVELVGRDGKPPDFVELLFREIIARGLGPAAYLGSVTVGLLASAFGAAQFSALSSLGLGFWLSSLLFTGALAGHLVALGREDRRSLADLVGRTMVIPRAVAAVHTETDAEERAELEAARRRRVLGVVGFEVVLVLATLGAPLLLSLRTPSRGEYAARLKLDADAKRFEHDPGNASLARELAEAYRFGGEPEKATAVMARHEAAQKGKTDQQEASLRKRLAESPGDEDAAGTLLELLENQNRIDDARAVRERLYKADGSKEAQAGYGVWLYQHDLNEQAVTQLRAALAAGLDEAEVHAYLGMALQDLGQKVEARHELSVALQQDPDLDSAADELQALVEEIGPEPAPKAAPKPAVKKKAAR